MGKSILVGDMPNSCSECFKNNGYNLLCNKKLTRYDIDGYINKRHPNCPLQNKSELLDALKLLHENTTSRLGMGRTYELWERVFNIVGGQDE